MSQPLRILQLVGSPTNALYRELSELYARGSIEALSDPARYDFVVAHVAPDGRWCFPATLDTASIDAASHRSFAEAVSTLAGLGLDAAIPQMFCRRGMTDLRALLDVMAIPYLGNRPLVMALAADKAKAKAIVSAAGVDVPESQVLRAGDTPRMALPAIVKPNDADNSEGVSLVRTEAQFAQAVASASTYSHEVLVEDYIELGREVRCGVVERNGRLECLPLEEYFVNPATRPIRRAEDKLKRKTSGDLTLGAKTRSESWIVPAGDPIEPAVWAAARRCYRALGCRQYGLFDFRIDPNGRPWFLEAGPYCSFAPQSVVVTMMEAAGTPLRTFFADALGELLAAR